MGPIVWRCRHHKCRNTRIVWVPQVDTATRWPPTVAIVIVTDGYKPAPQALPTTLWMQPIVTTPAVSLALFIAVVHIQKNVGNYTFKNNPKFDKFRSLTNLELLSPWNQSFRTFCTHSMSTDGAHQHTLGNAGSSSSHENRPPYYALAFIQKLWVINFFFACTFLFSR